MGDPVRRRWFAGVIGALLWAVVPSFSSEIKADFDGNGIVDLDDFFLFAEHFGQILDQPGFDSTFDIIGDGRIDQNDFFFFAENFGKRSGEPPPPGPLHTYIYIADATDNGVSVIDAATNLVLSYISFRSPSSVAVSSDNLSTYIVDAFVFVVLLDDFSVDYTLPMFDGTHVAVSPDNRLAFVTQASAGNVIFIDLKKRAVVDTVDVGFSPFGVAISPDGRTLYIVNTQSGTGSLSVIDIPSRTVKDTVEFETQPGLIVVSPDGDRGYLNSGSSGAISVLDLSSHRIVGTIQTDGEMVFGMDISPDGSSLYAGAGGDVLFIDADRNLIRERITVADQTGPLKVSPDGRRIYISGFRLSGGGTAIYVIDVASKEIIGKIRGFEFPFDIAFRTTSTEVPAARRNKPVRFESFQRL